MKQTTNKTTINNLPSLRLVIPFLVLLFALSIIFTESPKAAQTTKTAPVKKEIKDTVKTDSSSFFKILFYPILNPPKLTTK